MSGRTLLVTGASGQLGRQVVERLLARGGPDTIVAGSRDPSKLADLAARGVEVRRVDLDDAASLASAFAGVDRLLLVSTDAVDGTDRRARQHEAGVAAAKAAGVKHVVYTSALRASPTAAFPLAVDHGRTEAALAASGLGYTALRNSLYLEIVLTSLAGADATGVFATARQGGVVSAVSRADCAAVAASALVDTFDGQRTIDVANEHALTGPEIATAFSAHLGKPVQHVDIDLPSWVAGAVAAGLPEPVAQLFGAFEESFSRGEWSDTSDAVRRFTGRAPQSLADVLAGA